MVVETFKNGDAQSVRDRFQQHGRMMPDGIVYHGSRVDSARARCFQLMEADNAESLAPWMANWSDIVDFEVTPVLTSQDYWTQFSSSTKA